MPVVTGPGSPVSPGSPLTTLTPTFTWTPVTPAGVTGYQLNLYDITANKFYSYTLAGEATDSFVLPTALTQGDHYEWSLHALDGNVVGNASRYLYFVA